MMEKKEINIMNRNSIFDILASYNVAFMDVYSKNLPKKYQKMYMQKQQIK